MSQTSFLVLLLLSFESLQTEHKYTTLLLTDLAWILHYFSLFSAIKKESHLILGNFGII